MQKTQGNWTGQRLLGANGQLTSGGLGIPSVPKEKKLY